MNEAGDYYFSTILDLNPPPQKKIVISKKNPPYLQLSLLVFVAMKTGHVL